MKGLVNLMMGLGFLLAATGAYFYIKVKIPNEKMLKENKVELTARANEFLTCLTAGELPGCHEKLTTAHFKLVTPSPQLEAVTRNIREKLGVVKSTAPIDASYIASTSGKNKLIVFALNVVFEKDPKAAATFTFAKLGTDPFLLENYRLNSKVMQK